MGQRHPRRKRHRLLASSASSAYTGFRDWKSLNHLEFEGMKRFRDDDNGYSNSQLKQPLISKQKTIPPQVFILPCVIPSSVVKAVDLSDSWELWNSFRVLCEHHSQLSVALDVLSSLPSSNSLGRWIGEPVKSAILHTDSFLTNARGYPCLSKRHQNLLSSFFYYSVQIVLSGKAVHKVAASGATQPDAQQAQRHELRSYLEPLPEQERFQPLMDNLEAQTYETFEKDSVKYIQYKGQLVKHCWIGSLMRMHLQQLLYTSFKFHTTCDYIKVKLHKDLLHFETAYVVKLYLLAKLSPSQSVSFLIL
ncbi:hypothetical protein LXL04_013529 [Taraxacum kok-saghyz]